MKRFVFKQTILTNFISAAIVVLVCLLFAMSEALSVDYQLYDSPFPTEHYNGPATNCAPSGGLFDTASAKTIEKLYPAAFVFVNREPEELYVVGGMGQIPNYIAKVNPITLDLVRKTPLNLGTSTYWTPSVVVHANGYVYVTAQNICYKLDSDINIVNHYILPITDGKYNSIKIFSDGNLICKGFGSKYSSVTLLDQNLDPIIPELVLPEKSYGRVSVHIHDNKEYVYLTGETTLVRYEYISGASPQLEKDNGWSYKYRSASSRRQTAGGIASFIGNNAYFGDNANPSPRPLDPIHLFRVNLDNPLDAQRFTPFGLPMGYRFNKHLVDPVNGIIVVGDSTNDKVGAYRYLGNNQFQELWVKDYESDMVWSTSSSTKQLYVSDFKYRRDNIVILDIETGEELKRIVTSSRLKSLSGVTLGWNNDVFYVSGNYSVRIYNNTTPKHHSLASQAPPAPKPAPLASMLFPNFPNPFNPDTWIPYSIATDAFVSLDIYNLQGTRIRHIELGYKHAGVYISKNKAAYWDGRNELGEEVPSGIYFYSIRSGKFSTTRRMTILK